MNEDQIMMDHLRRLAAEITSPTVSAAHARTRIAALTLGRAGRADELIQILASHGATTLHQLRNDPGAMDDVLAQVLAAIGHPPSKRE